MRNSEIIFILCKSFVQFLPFIHLGRFPIEFRKTETEALSPQQMTKDSDSPNSNQTPSEYISVADESKSPGKLCATEK